ncbi:hypothetical protein J6590_037017 [Homalodisca vitripennis]|nr:hypothetical protein J6590_037017 [Homalodisca vitripennis]
MTVIGGEHGGEEVRQRHRQRVEHGRVRQDPARLAVTRSRRGGATRDTGTRLGYTLKPHTLIRFNKETYSDSARSTAGDDFWSLVGFVPYQRFLLASTRVCHLLPGLAGEAGSELASPSSRGT